MLRVRGRRAERLRPAQTLHPQRLPPAAAHAVQQGALHVIAERHGEHRRRGQHRPHLRRRAAEGNGGCVRSDGRKPRAERGVQVSRRKLRAGCGIRIGGRKARARRGGWIVERELRAGRGVRIGGRAVYARLGVRIDGRKTCAGRGVRVRGRAACAGRGVRIGGRKMCAGCMAYSGYGVRAGIRGICVRRGGGGEGGEEGVGDGLAAD